MARHVALSVGTEGDGCSTVHARSVHWSRSSYVIAFLLHRERDSSTGEIEIPESTGVECCHELPPVYPFSFVCKKFFILCWTRFGDTPGTSPLMRPTRDCSGGNHMHHCRPFWLITDVHTSQCARKKRLARVAATQTIEASIHVAMVDSATLQDGTNVPRPRFDWPASFVSVKAEKTRMQARPSDGLGQLAHSTPAPHRRFSAVAPRTRRRVATPLRFPIRVGRSVCCPTMTTTDAIVIRV